jgi:zinc protease
MDGVSYLSAEESINEVIEEMKRVPVPDDEMEKLKNKFESSMVFSNTSVLNKAMNLGFHELIGDANGINKEVEIYNNVSPKMVMNSALNYLQPSNCSSLQYKSKKSKMK